MPQTSGVSTCLMSPTRRTRNVPSRACCETDPHSFLIMGPAINSSSPRPDASLRARVMCVLCDPKFPTLLDLTPTAHTCGLSVLQLPLFFSQPTNILLHSPYLCWFPIAPHSPPHLRLASAETATAVSETSWRSWRVTPSASVFPSSPF